MTPIEDELSRLRSANAYYIRTIVDLQNKCNWLNKNELKSWIINERPKSFRLAIPASLAPIRVEEGDLEVALATEVVYHREDIWKYKYSTQISAQMIGGLSTLHSALDAGVDFRNLEQMYEQHLADRQTIRDLWDTVKLLKKELAEK